MWYYVNNKQALGPFSKDAMIEFLRSGKIFPNTLVWRQGMDTWVELGRSELSDLIGSAPTSKERMSLTKPAISSRSLSSLFWWWFGLELFIIPYYMMFLFINPLAENPGHNFVVPLILSLCWLPAAASTVLRFILTYKYWQVIQDGFARMTPGKAIGFMFIPYFNYYWFLPLYFGLAKDMNAYCVRHFGNVIHKRVPKAHPGLALGYVISFWSTMVISFIGMITMYARLLGNVELISSHMTHPPISEILYPFMSVMIVLNLLLVVFHMVLFFDFYYTSKGILQIQESK